jgi:hypothetical protein
MMTCTDIILYIEIALIVGKSLFNHREYILSNTGLLFLLVSECPEDSQSIRAGWLYVDANFDKNWVKVSQIQ